jgi:hypothetical protein
MKRRFFSSLFLAIFLLTTIDIAYAQTHTKSTHKTTKSSEKKKSSDDDDAGPCDGLFNILNRPSNADSACVVPLNKVLIEMGARFLQLKGGGSAQDFPELLVRFGLLDNTEFGITLPDYLHQSVFPHSGTFATDIEIKHLFCATKKSVLSVEGILILPSGSYYFGSAGLGLTVNGIASYNLTKKLNLTGMLGVSSLTTPRSQCGRRYNSINPDLILTYQFNEKSQAYGEVYGQSNTGPGQGSGANFDMGYQYLLNKNWALDISYSNRIYGELSIFDNYISVGTSILL